MYQDNVVLCGASAYEQKYYFNRDFDSLPDHVKKELQIMCVLYTEEIGGIFTLEFDEDGNLQFKTEAAEADGFYDDIGGALKIKQLRREKEELLESLECIIVCFSLGKMWITILRENKIVDNHVLTEELKKRLRHGESRENKRILPGKSETWGFPTVLCWHLWLV